MNPAASQKISEILRRSQEAESEINRPDFDWNSQRGRELGPREH